VRGFSVLQGARFFPPFAGLKIRIGTELPNETAILDLIRPDGETLLLPNYISYLRNNITNTCCNN
jgi:hypothetical protein